jgi:hypothetical protein
MTNRLLLYIDILGFSQLIRRKKQLIPKLFDVLDKSNAHKHGTFRVIQFSDTLLVYNEPKAKTLRSKQYCAMFLCEFAQEIQYMLLGRDAFIRGLITHGEFEDTGPTPNAAYKHVRGFWGEALIRAYRTEKSIKAIGLFVDKSVHPFMNIFETHLFDKERRIWFVDTATMLRDKFLEGDDFSFAEQDLLATGNAPMFAYDLLYLKRLFKHSHDMRLSPAIRSKYLTTWEIYRRKYSGLCTALEREKFVFGNVIRINWTPLVRRIGTPRGYFG